jgi:RHS repeat-associated protein
MSARHQNQASTKARQAALVQLGPLVLAAALVLLPALSQAEPVPDGGPLKSGLGYSANGNLTTVNLPKGSGQTTARQQTHRYDGLNRRIASTLPPPMAGASSPTLGYGWDALDQLKSVTTPLSDPNSITTTYTTNGLGNTSPQLSPDSGITHATYEFDGRLKTRTDARGKSFTYLYDDLGRLLKVSYTSGGTPSGTPSQFEYDGGTPTANNSTGQLSKLTDESGTTTWAHDGFGRVLSKTVKNTGTNQTFVLSQAWGDTGTAAGKLQNQTYPSLARVNYVYDASGRLKDITLNPVKTNGKATNLGQTLTLLSSLTYDALNQVSGWAWGGGVPYSRAYDDQGRLKTYRLGNPNGTGNAAGLIRTLGYDDAGRLISYTHTNASGTAQPAFDHSFGYDGLDRLAQQQQQATTYGYGYDLNGNRSSQTLGGTLYNNVVDTASNRLSKERAPGGVTNSFGYDEAGNLKSESAGAITYTHSARGRLSGVSIGTEGVSYLYNALEQRLVKTGPSSRVPGGARYFVYDEQGHPIGEYDSSGNPVYEVVYLNDTPIAVITQTRTGSGTTLNVQTNLSYVYADHIDTPRVIVRSSDHAIQWRWDQAEAYGTTPPNDNPNALGAFAFNLRFPGQLYDSESNLVYNHHRYFDASTGRFVQSDPIGLGGGINTYAYVNGNPLSLTDPQGLNPAAGCVLGSWLGPFGCAGGRR